MTQTSQCVIYGDTDSLSPLQAIFVVLILGWFFLPVYLTSGVSSHHQLLFVWHPSCGGGGGGKIQQQPYYIQTRQMASYGLK